VVLPAGVVLVVLPAGAASSGTLAMVWLQYPRLARVVAMRRGGAHVAALGTQICMIGMVVAIPIAPRCVASTRRDALSSALILGI
jgi:hypothetical protein